jgi:hypothetical protein
LTVPQKARLLLDCLPFVFFSVVAAGYVTVLRKVYGELKLSILVFLAIVLLVTGYQALQRMRDIASGVALVREDVLRNVLGRGSQRRRRSHHAGEFAALGRLKLTPNAFRQAIGGRRHRVTYSPASKIAWELEAAEL